MNATEKIILKQIIENLEISTKTKWTSGYLDDWTEYAKKMHHAIRNNNNILKSLLTTPDE